MQKSRREIIHSFGAVGALGAAALAFSQAPRRAVAAEGDAGAATDYLSGPYLDLRTTGDNQIAYARLASDLDESKQRPGWFKGYVMGVRPGEAIRDLFGFAGFGVSRLETQPDGAIARVLREVGFYTDLRSGEILEEWHNPYLDETVPVVPIANDPFNMVIRDHFSRPPQFGGLNEADVRPVEPFLLPWQQVGERLQMERHIHLHYPSALDPEVWVRESSGERVRVSEFFAYSLNGADMQNPDLTAVPSHGVWNRTTPWLPWMLMGQAEGHCQYACFMGSGEDLEQIHDRALLDYTEKHYAKYFDAPETYSPDTPSLSSLEMYEIEQTPAPPKQDAGE
ncbi:MAG: DUF1838 domain-containing protein [Gammaproteobacteria bacterium]|nr:DUF1838 domain-containing protein [Gammaproteobacteria bacterium]